MKAIFALLFKAIRNFLFYTLLFLRGPFQYLSKLIAGFFLLGFIGTLLFGAPLAVILLALFIGIGVIFLSVNYDRIILWLNPTGMELTLEN